ncbi:DUF6779 domain-containing protein [Amycolatopsis magusensis]|uniref:DUF6779 domain-containing protein n=1 Tax=Amycolatopsis magusensis TaxID=882444 RepID=UPI0037ADEDEE
MTGVGDDSRGRRSGRPWLVVGFALAVAATAALVLAQDLRWLRLGIIAALWAALIGAFIAAKYRKQVTTTEDEVAQAQAVYELELEREIAARREFELELEAESRERAQEDSREELDALRSEVIALRESLQSLFGGEVLFEQVALTAQATRMRSLSEDQRLVQASGSVSKPAQIGSGKQSADPDTGDRPTELIERVIERKVVTHPERRRRIIDAETVQKPGESSQSLPNVLNPPSAQQQQHHHQPQPQQHQPQPQRRQEPPEDAGPPTRRVRPADTVGSAAARASKAAGEARAETARRQAKQAELDNAASTKRRTPQPPQPEERRPRREDMTRPGITPPRPAAKPQPARAPEPVQPKQPAPKPAAARAEPADRYLPTGRPTEISKEFDLDWAAEPTWESGRRNGAPAARGNGTSRNGAPPPRTGGRRRAEHTGEYEAVRPEPAQPKQPEPKHEPARGAHRPQEAAAQQNPPVRAVQGESRPGGRRRRSEEEGYQSSANLPLPAAKAEPAQPVNGGGRRRRAEGEPPSWERLAEAAPANGSRHSGGQSGGHSAGHSKAEEEKPEGTHAAGRSVNELLAAHGAGGTTPRRRRRAED